MSTPAEVIALVERLVSELTQDDQDAKIEAKGAESKTRRQGRAAAIAKLKADIKQAVQTL